MWSGTIQWIATKVSDLLYLATGKRRALVLDPMFYTPINACFKRRALASLMWTNRAFAERMVTKCGVSPHPSAISGNYVIDQSFPREELIAGYADMCIAVACPFWWRRDYVLWKEHFKAAPLPEGWIRLSEEERLALELIFIERAAVRELQLEMYRLNTIRCQVRSRVKECVPPEGEECPICFELATDSSWGALYCGHEFHFECILKLVRQTCPLCRADII